MRVTVILIVVGALVTVPKDMRGIRNQRKNKDHSVHSIVPGRVLEIGGDLLSLRLKRKTII